MAALELVDMIPVPTAFGLPLDSELAQPLNLFMLKLQETGVKHKLEQKWGIVGQKDNGDRGQEAAVVLGFENVSFPFIVLGFGVGVALMLGFVEVCFNLRLLCVKAGL